VQPALILVDAASEKTLPDHNFTQWLLDADHDNLSQRISTYQGKSFTPAKPELSAVMGIKFTGGTQVHPKG
jgi:hypothetical protein